MHKRNHNTLICLIQARNTGRFLFVENGTKWTFLSFKGDDLFQTAVSVQMEYADQVFNGDPPLCYWFPPNVVHYWAKSEEECQISDIHQWCSLYDFPEQTTDLINLVANNRIVLDYCSEPPSDF